MEVSWFHSALVFLCSAVLFVPLFKKLGMGAIMGYLVAGVLLGPYVFNLISDPTAALHFAEFGVIMLLFIIGLELEPKKLWQMRYKIGVLGFCQVFFTGFILCIFLRAMVEDWTLGWILGLTLALSSTAFAIQIMAEFRILPTPLGRLGFAVLLFQDLAVIPLLFIVDTMSVSKGPDFSSDIVMSVFGLVSLVVFGKVGLNPFLNLVAKYGNREVMTAASLLIVLGSAEALHLVGLSKGLGAFIAGLLLANSNYRHHIETDIEPFKGLLLGLFFIAVGMNINIELLSTKLFEVLFYALLLVVIKTVIIATICHTQKHRIHESLFLGILLGQGGEFAFVIVAQALSGGLIMKEDADIIILVVSISMAMTAPLAFGFRKFFIEKRTSSKSSYENPDKEFQPEVIIAGFGRFGQIVGRILAARQIPFTALDKDARHVDFVRKLGNKLYYGDATRLDLLINAGVKNAKLLVIATDNVDESLQISMLVKEHYKDIAIVARARNRAHAYKLHAAGIKLVVRETFESSLQAAMMSLMELGYTEGQAIESIDMFRMHDERILVEAVQHKDDLDTLLKIAQEGRKELEQLFNKD